MTKEVGPPTNTRKGMKKVEDPSVVDAKIEMGVQDERNRREFSIRNRNLTASFVGHINNMSGIRQVERKVEDETPRRKERGC